MKRVTLIACVLLTLFACGSRERALEFDGYRLIGSPEEAPDLFDRALVYEDATILSAGVHGHPEYISAQEGVVVMEANTSIDEVRDHYLQAFASDFWQVIQTRQNETESLIMAESPNRRLATVIIRGDSPVQIKVYVKHSSLR